MESALWQVYRKGEAMHFHELAILLAAFAATPALADEACVT